MAAVSRIVGRGGRGRWPHTSDRSVRPTWAGMYHCSVHKLAQQVLGYVRKHDLLRAGDRVGAAVSGGADSVALLGSCWNCDRSWGLSFR